MRRLTRHPVLLAGIGAMSLLAGACSSHGSHPGESMVTGGSKAWALATTAILTSYNRGRLDMLPTEARSDSSTAQARRILHDWWEIDRRSDLLLALGYLERSGHRAEFQKMGQSLLAMSPERYEALLSEQRDAAGSVNLIRLIRAHFRKYGDSSLVAWDYSRYIMLCRWGYMVGFLSENEAWAFIVPAARTIQRSFHSWNELGDDYLVGREFWSREQTDRDGRIYRTVEDWLLRERTSPWNRLPWTMDLGGPPCCPPGSAASSGRS